ncbi:related to Translation initiation factor eIF-2B subunit gamma [Saccharomycodes ludwigii]|uniref:Translation initiation factor eIF2B subunit gamma n=1 Tax=Saccharomycodes ludwigii TaxID=36035 RepID=A0A376B1F6_9ASCO|nr:related to Translation initiation factor eIF-2B subunit gamma [Saccharomycodes ludwigii]
MDYQAFIFCGKGHGLEPFSKTRGDTGIVKALLPVGNKPMIEYVLDWCEQAGFKEINIVIDKNDLDLLKEGLGSYLLRREESYKKLMKNLNSVSPFTNSSSTLSSASVGHNYSSSGNGSASGVNLSHNLKKPTPIKFISSECQNTGECLAKELLPKITSNFVLLPCDFITDIPPQILSYQFLNMSDDNLCMSVYYKNKFENIDKKQLSNCFTVYSEEEDSPVLLDIYSKESVDKNKYLQIRTQLLWRFPKATVSTTLLNSFIYFCSYKLVSILGDAENKINCNKSLTKVFRDLSRRSWQHSTKKETVGIFVIPEVGNFLRSNNLSSYMEANRYILKVRSTYSSNNTSAHTHNNNSTVGGDSFVGGNCTFGEKTNIKKSVIGNNCKIGKKCRIVGCVIFPNLEIEDDCHIENCIIGNFAKISKKCKLTNCYVESSYEVGEKSMLKGETLKSLYLADNSDEDNNNNENDEDNDHDDDDDDDDEYMYREEISGEDDEEDGEGYEYDDEYGDDDIFER